MAFRKVFSWTALPLAVWLLSSPLAHAGEVSKEDNGAVQWEAGEEGVVIEWDADGAFNRIFAAYYQPVNFPDRRGINKAKTIAEEKAKAAIIRFMDQTATSSRLVEEVNSDSETAVRNQKSSGEDSITKDTQRKMVETLTEVTGSYSSGRLRGVIRLESGYDEKKEEAWVKVGISRKTMRAAQSVSNAINAPDAGGPNGGGKGNGAAGQGANGQTNNMYQGSEVRKSQQKDW